MPDRLSEPAILTTTLVITVLCIAIVEAISPRRKLHAPLTVRWTSNLLVYLLGSSLVRFSIPVLTVGIAVLANERGFGLLNNIQAPIVVAFAVSFLIIDFSRYLQHLMLHRVPLLWRLHLAHHTDQDYDFSTGLRFHPVEGLFTVAYDVAIVALLGAPPLAVLTYELVKVVWAIFAHANIYVPLPIDRAMRTVLVTPDLHRIHHSAAPGETDTNFGGLTPVWDRLLGTYRDQPSLGHENMIIGLADYQDPRYLRLGAILMQPLRLREPQLAQAESSFDKPGS